MMHPFRSRDRAREKPPVPRFVESVRVRKETRLNWKHALLGGFWILIAIKCLLVHWAVVYWAMPFHSAWVWAPTLFAAAICTIVFLAGGNDEHEG